MSPWRTIALVGLRASGKTTLGEALAQRLTLPYVDLDDEIVRRVNDVRILAPGEVWSTFGESAFRSLEAESLEHVLARAKPVVLATGGGVIERAQNRELLKHRALVVWLQVAIPELQRRLRGDSTERPALLGFDPIDEVPVIAARREPLYEEVAHVKLECGDREPAELVEELVRRLGMGKVP
jgi:shikimate kinase